jgi:hypothetical protein
MMLRCMSPDVALFGHGAMSDLSPLSAAKRTSRLKGARSGFHHHDVATPRPDHCRALAAWVPAEFWQSFFFIDPTRFLRRCGDLSLGRPYELGYLAI